MSVNTLNLLSLICYIASGVFGAAAVIMFFVLKIKSAIDQLSGRAQKRAVKNMRYKNNKEKSSQEPLENKSPTVKLRPQNNTSVLNTEDTAVLNENADSFSYAAFSGKFLYTDNPAELGFIVDIDIVLSESRGIE